MTRFKHERGHKDDHVCTERSRRRKRPRWLHEARTPAFPALLHSALPRPGKSRLFTGRCEAVIRPHRHFCTTKIENAGTSLVPVASTTYELKLQQRPEVKEQRHAALSSSGSCSTSYPHSFAALLVPSTCRLSTTAVLPATCLSTFIIYHIHKMPIGNTHTVFAP